MGFLHRSSSEKMFQQWPALRGVLQECAGCHAVGLKPRILSTRKGDYGMRSAIQGKFEELRLGPLGLCDRCAEEAGFPNEKA